MKVYMPRSTMYSVQYDFVQSINILSIVYVVNKILSDDLLSIVEYFPKNIPKLNITRR